uniref:non-specific serine/threonine protein kinase n=1 Tax=Kalanchoe fedtschenkoi TaxID=63787 RepID=A0A7N0UVK5_KALFE
MLSIAHFVFSLLLPLIKLAAVHGDSYSGYCPSSKCGDVDIRYPFYEITDSASPAFCGYPRFGLRCPSPAGNPVLDLESHAYIVKNINYPNATVALVDSDIGSTSCPRARNNLTINGYPLQNPNLNLIFYFNCTNTRDDVPYIECLGVSEGRKSYVFLEGSEPQGFDWVEMCEDKVVAAVMEDSGLDDLIGGFGEAMKKGFELDWGMRGNCGMCEASRGRCGWYNKTGAAAATAKDFFCYCEDGGTATVKCKRGRSIRTKLIIGFSVGGGTALIMGVFFFIYLRRRKASYVPSYFTRNISSDPSSITDPEKMGALYGVKFFTYDELEEATDNFNESREIGDGGFGTVYLGKLKDGRTVAVKRLYENNYKRVEQFLNEVEILTRLRHKNLVMLYGCTSRHSRELLLVYEYISNGTVADHLHGRNVEPGSLSWQTRLKIAVETASALKYLHASDIIHRDVKTHNILLDDNFNVKVADFGLSRLFPLDVTHVSTCPQGTPGYVDPEYHQCYQLTDKSDVYSFGVVLVELISSKPAVDITRHRHEINLSNMALNKIQNDALHELVDPTLGFDKDSNTQKMITAVAELSFRCLQSDKDLRPSMQEVLEILTSIQCQDSQKAEELDIFSDEFVLLKSGPLPLSPDSVTVKWISSSSASN